VIYLELEDLLHIAERTLGPFDVADLGLVEAAAARPAASAFGEDAYPTVVDKAAALFHSLAKNHPLVDGNKRLALAGGAAFLWINGIRLTMSNDEAYDFIVAIASGDLDTVDGIAHVLRRTTRPRPA
jgi:death-on-curing protein